MRRLAILAAALALAGAARGADEITANVVIKIVDGYLDIQRAANTSWDITNAAPNVASQTEVISTNAASALNFEDVSVPGWTWFRNVTAAGGNDIKIGVIDASTNFLPFARLEPGEYGLIRLATTGIYALSVGTNEASSRLEKMCVDD